MIYSVQGDILELKNTDGFCLVAVKSKSGIGFEVKVSHKTAEKIQNESEVFLHTEFILRENSMELFGFLTLEEKTIFLLKHNRACKHLKHNLIHHILFLVFLKIFHLPKL